MKKIIPLVIAGIFGGLIVLGGIYFFKVEHIQRDAFSPVYATQVNTKINTKPGSTLLPFDFTEAAEISMPVVVHIKAAESEALAKQRHQKNRSQDPFKDLFGGDLFFGNPFNSPYQIKQGAGSGVIISEDGYIVTNNHVIEFADEVEVTLYDNRQFQATIVGTDPKTDMAVLKIEAKNLPTLKYADSNKAKVGQWVLAVGNPLELTSTVTAGIISAKGRDINIISGQDAIEAFIQTDAAVNPGNSGGALVDAQGKLLGINTAIATQTGYFSGYSFAIPVNMMKKIVDDIIEFGSYQRGYLGITIMDLDGDLSDELNLNITQGVLIQNVLEGSAAQYAGLLPNDVIVRIDDREVKSSPELQEIVGSAKVGDTLNLTVNRNGKSKEFPVRLKNGNY
jgi:Do/DeqQ family serine protease